MNTEKGKARPVLVISTPLVWLNLFRIETGGHTVNTPISRWKMAASHTDQYQDGVQTYYRLVQELSDTHLVTIEEAT